MSAYDGSIRIDTSINSKSFNAGIKSMIGSVKSLALSLGLAFGIGGLFTLGKNAVETASQMANAMIGLQSIVEGQGKSFQQAKKFIQEYIADGLVPLANAASAYKNLAARGYTTDQIETTLNALKNSAAFGRQGSLSMGQAIQNATEGLKNENSILVDNAGVTKNVSMMWKDYAESIGTTVGALTKEQKIQAEVNGILEETKFQTGDAAKLATTYSGQVSALGVSWMNLKAALGNALIPVLMQILPYIKAAIDAMTVFFNQVGQMVNVLFGTNISIADAMTDKTSELTDNTNDAAESQENLAEETENATKAARGALAAFDELNVLQQESVIKNNAGKPGEPENNTPILPEINETPIVEGLTELQQRFLEFKNKMMEYLQPVIGLIGAFGAVWESVKETLAPIWTWFWEVVLVPLGKWSAEMFLLFLKWLTERLYALSDWISENQTLFLVFVGFFALLLLALLIILSPAAQFIAILLLIGAVLAATAVVGFLLGYSLRKAWDMIVDAWWNAEEWFSTNVIEPLKEKFGKIWSDIKDLAAQAKEKVLETWNNVTTWFEDNVVNPLKEKFKTAWEFIGIFANDAWAVLQYAWSLAAEWFSTNVIEPLKEKFLQMWEDIRTITSEAWASVQETWVEIATWFDENVITPLTEAFAEAWAVVTEVTEEAWARIQEAFGQISDWLSENVKRPIQEIFGEALDWVSNKWEETFNGIKDIVRGVVNGIIEIMNDMLSGMTEGINGLIDGANEMGSIVPGWINIPYVNAPQIPYLATGAVIPPNSQFLAVLGDQRGGRNIEAPEGLIRQIVSEEIGKVQADIRITFDGDLASLVRELKPHIDRETVRIGGSLISGGVTTS